MILSNYFCWIFNSMQNKQNKEKNNSHPISASEKFLRQDFICPLEKTTVLLIKSLAIVRPFPISVFHSGLIYYLLPRLRCGNIRTLLRTTYGILLKDIKWGARQEKKLFLDTYSPKALGEILAAWIGITLNNLSLNNLESSEFFKTILVKVLIDQRLSSPSKLRGCYEENISNRLQLSVHRSM